MLREIEPGVPLSVALGPRPLSVVTKAGAFGSPAALLGAYRELAGIRRRGAGA
jgi:4-hydroxythreonine-4-phosphate dehydrogenase